MKRHRVQYEIPENRLQELIILQEELDLTTRTDLLNTALTLLEWVVEQKRKGREIAAIDEKQDNYWVLVMPALQRVQVVEEPLVPA